MPLSSDLISAAHSSHNRPRSHGAPPRSPPRDAAASRQPRAHTPTRPTPARPAHTPPSAAARRFHPLPPSVSGSRSLPRRPAPSRRAARLSPRCPRRAVGGRGDAEAHQLAQGRPRHLDREHGGRADPQHPRPGVGAGPILRSALQLAAALLPARPAPLPAPGSSGRALTPRRRRCADDVNRLAHHRHRREGAQRYSGSGPDERPDLLAVAVEEARDHGGSGCAPQARAAPGAARGPWQSQSRAAEPEAEQVLRGTVGLVERQGCRAGRGGSAGRGGCLLSSGTLIIPAANASAGVRRQGVHPDRDAEPQHRRADRLNDWPHCLQCFV